MFYVYMYISAISIESVYFRLNSHSIFARVSKLIKLLQMLSAKCANICNYDMSKIVHMHAWGYRWTIRQNDHLLLSIMSILFIQTPYWNIFVFSYELVFVDFCSLPQYQQIYTEYRLYTQMYESNRLTRDEWLICKLWSL